MAGRTMDDTLIQATQTQINNLGERMDRGFNEVKEMLRGFDERLRDIETREAGCQPVILVRLNSAENALKTHDGQIETMQKNVIALTKGLDRLEGVARWLLGIITALIIALIVAYATGKMTILFSG